MEHDKRVKRNEYNPNSGLLVVPETRNEHSETEARTGAPSTTPRTNLPLGNGLATFLTKKRPEHSSTIDSSSSKKRRRSDQHGGTMYRGIVRLLPKTVPEYTGNLGVYCTTMTTPPSYQCFVTMVDASNVGLPVLVTGTAGDVLFDLPAKVAVLDGHRQTPFDTNVAWMVSIQSVWKRSKEFFILKAIERIDSGS